MKKGEVRRYCKRGHDLNIYENKTEKRWRRCTECDKITREIYKQENIEIIISYQKNWKLFNRYGLTSADFIELLIKQEHKCDICKVDIFGCIGKNRYCVDHCHTTNKVRGVLCQRCNSALAFLDDKIENFKMAIEYLERNK